MSATEGRPLDAKVVLMAAPGQSCERSFGVVNFLAPEASPAGSMAIAELDRNTKAGDITSVKMSKVVPIPVGLDPELALLVPQLATSLAIWDQLDLEMGEAAVVLADAPLSSFLGQAALWRGASPVVVIGSLHSYRLPSGIAAISADSSDELIESLRAVTKRCPGWAAVDTTGRPEMLDLILDAAPKWGRIALCGGSTAAATVDFYNNVHRKGILLNGSVLASSAVFARPHGQRLVVFAARAARILSHPLLAQACRRWAH